MSYNISTGWVVVLVIAAVWELMWKAIALWKAARRNQLVWFILIMLINTVGILPILYVLLTKDGASHGND